eukprot:1411847-Amphidinium_carterae.1
MGLVLAAHPSAHHAAGLLQWRTPVLSTGLVPALVAMVAESFPKRLPQPWQNTKFHTNQPQLNCKSKYSLLQAAQ